jgi:hypothetical protein
MHALGYAPGESAAAMRARGVPVLHSMDELPGYVAALH